MMHHSDEPVYDLRYRSASIARAGKPSRIRGGSVWSSIIRGHPAGVRSVRPGSPRLPVYAPSERPGRHATSRPRPVNGARSGEFCGASRPGQSAQEPRRLNRLRARSPGAKAISQDSARGCDLSLYQPSQPMGLLDLVESSPLSGFTVSAEFERHHRRVSTDIYQTSGWPER